jgi:hypothetical protein
MAVVKAQVISPRKIILTVTLTLLDQCMRGFVDGLKLKNSDGLAVEVDEQSRLVSQRPTEILVLDAALSFPFLEICIRCYS